MNNQLTINPAAQPKLAALSVEERTGVLDSIRSLQKEDPAKWPEQGVHRLTSESAVYVLRVSPILLALVEVLQSGQIELADIVRPESLKYFSGVQDYAGTSK